MTNAEIVERGSYDLIFFAQAIAKQAFEFPTPDFHYELASLLLDNNVTKLGVEAPRGYAKSTLCIFTVLHHITYGIGQKYVVIQSKTLSYAKQRLSAIKNILEHSEEYKELYGYRGMVTATEWNKDRIVLSDGTVIEAKGYGQQTRGGLTDDWSRVTLYYLDDPEDENNTKTPQVMSDNLDKFLTTLKGLTKKTGRTVVVGTPINQACLIEKIEKMGGWLFKRYSAVNESTKEVLWKEMDTYEELMQDKEDLLSIGKVSKWYSEVQCLITGDDDALFVEDDLRWWDGYYSDGNLHITHQNRRKTQNNNWEMIQLEQERIIPVNNYMGVDPASSLKQSADLSTTVPIAFDGWNIYQLPYFEKRVRPTEHARQIQKMFLELSPKKTYIESTAYQEALRSIMREWMTETQNYVGGLEKKWTPRGDKDDRLTDLQRFTEAHRYYLQPGMHRMLDEMLLFPRGRKNLLDGLWYATRNLKKPVHIHEPIYNDDEKVLMNRGITKTENWQTS